MCLTNKTLETLAAFSRDEDIRKNSSSGGLFSVLARRILAKNGVVYGVTLNAECSGAEFKRIMDETDLKSIRGSKYLQAQTGNTFYRIKQDLDNNKLVLFSGTGCQVNGLKSFLRKDYENLICIDVVCHGTPSPALWRKYIESMETKMHSKITGVNFRCKDIGWKNYGIKCINSKGKQIYTPTDSNPYMQMFLKNYSLRPSCYECSAKLYKAADISIADFWGVDTILPEMNDNLGISLVLLRSARGKLLFDSVKDEIICKEVTYESAVAYNPAEYVSAEKPEERDMFFADMNKMSFAQLSKKYLPVSLKRKIKNIILRHAVWNKRGM